MIAQYSKWTGTLILVMVLGICIWYSSPAGADIYCYRDKNGVWHFTNIRGHSRYRIYLRTTGKKASEYIKDYENIICEASRRFRVKPALVKAVIRAESDFDNKAVSCKGAQGLMQLMPETAEEMRVRDPFDPAENIFGGTKYLSLLLKRFNNNWNLALAAYNAGPETVDSYNGIPPFPETKTFVKRVLKYYKKYNMDDG